MRYKVIDSRGKVSRYFFDGGKAGSVVSGAMEAGAAIADTAKQTSKINEELASERSAEQAKTAAQGFSSSSVDQLINDSENAQNLNTNISSKDYLLKGYKKQTAIGSLKAGAAGAKAGATFGPWGAAVGAVVGALGGLAGGLFGRKEAKRKARAMAAKQSEANKAANAMQDSKMDAAAENLAKKQEENAFLNSYAHGGRLKHYQERYANLFPDDTFIF